MNDTQPDVREGLPSASSFERLAHCPGSPALEALCPKPEQSDLAAEGSRIAAARESGDDSALKPSEKDIKARLDEMEQKAVSQWLESLGNPPGPPTVYREHRFWIRKNNVKIFSAQVDVAYVLKPFALIIDDKSGFKNPTDAKANWQLRTQLLALVHNHAGQIIRVKVAWQRARFSTVFDDCEYNPEDIARAEREFHHALWRAEQPDAPRHPGPWCDFCRAKAHCRDAAAYALLPSVGIHSLEGRGAKDKAAQLVARMPIEDCILIWKRSSIIEKILDAVQARLKALSPDELQALGLKLKPGADVSEITNLPEAFTILKTHGLVEHEGQFLDFCKVVLGNLDEHCVPLLAKRTGATQEQAKLTIRNLLAPVTAKKPKAPSLVALNS